MMELKVFKVNPNAKLPEYAHVGDSGLDLYSVVYEEIKPFGRALINTGICIELPENTEAQIRPRSGLALKYGITVLNTPGTIDQGYRGEIGIILLNTSSEIFVVEKGMKIAQMVIKPTLSVKVVEITELSSSDRKSNGFGSTGI